MLSMDKVFLKIGHNTSRIHMEDLVLFWGWTRDDNSYKGLTDLAPKGWRIYDLNLEELAQKGFISTLSENITKFLDEKKLKRVSLVGHSMGGALALQYAYHNPERVKKLFLLDSSGIYGHEKIPQLIKNFILSQTILNRKKAPENLRVFYRIFRKPFVYIKLANYAHKVDLQKEARDIRVPTVIMWGEKDKLIPLWQGQKLHKLIKNSKFIVLPNVGHDWPLYKPELFWESIKNG